MISFAERAVLSMAFAVLTLFSGPVAHAQERNTNVFTGEGFEAFPSVQYVGGDARFTKKQLGILVLTDSTIEFHRCLLDGCAFRKGDGFFAESRLWSIPLKNITAISAVARNTGPSTAGRVLWGVLATDKNREYIALTYDTDASAEAPVWETPKNMAATFEAKLRFRLRKAGLVLPSGAH